MKRKAFSYIEISYVMLIGAAIFTLAVPSFIDSAETSKIITTKENVFLAIKQQQEYFNKNRSYENVDRVLVKSDNTATGDDYLKFYSSNGSYFETRQLECSDGLIGFYVKIEDPELKSTKYESFVEYNSCTDTTLLRPEI